MTNRRLMILLALPFIISCFARVSHLASAAPMPLQSGISLELTHNLSGAYSAAYNPQDNLAYATSRKTNNDGVYRLNSDGTTSFIVGADRPSGLEIDPDDGDIFVAEDYDGDIYRTAFNSVSGEPELTRSKWVSGFDAGDDDPAGIAFVPSTYTGSAVMEGSAVSTDRGNGSTEELWQWSPDSNDSAVPEMELVDENRDSGWFDVAVNDSHVVILNRNSNNNAGLLELNANGTVSPLSTDPRFAKADTAVFDPVSGELYVGLDHDIVRFNLDSGDITEIITGFDRLRWGSLAVSTDGNRLFAADNIAGKVFEFSVVPATNGDFDSDGDVDGNDFLVWQRSGSPDPLSSGDLMDWQTNYDMTMPIVSTLATVPEPATCIVLLTGALALQLRRRPYHQPTITQP